MAASERAFEDAVIDYHGSPERMAMGGYEHYWREDFGPSLLFYRRSIDMLHTEYAVGGSTARYPSVEDQAIVDGFVYALSASLELKPDAPVDDTVRVVTLWLQGIVTACVEAGLSSDLYSGALESLAFRASSVPAEDIVQ